MIRLIDVGDREHKDVTLICDEGHVWYKKALVRRWGKDSFGADMQKAFCPRCSNQPRTIIFTEDKEDAY